MPSTHKTPELPEGGNFTYAGLLLQKFDAYLPLVQLVSALIRAVYLYTVLFCLSYTNQGFFYTKPKGNELSDLWTV